MEKPPPRVVERRRTIRLDRLFFGIYNIAPVQIAAAQTLYQDLRGRHVDAKGMLYWSQRRAILIHSLAVSRPDGSQKKSTRSISL
jgi:hypothetical protein